MQHSNNESGIHTLGIIGSGQMGQGIAQIAILAGLEVKLYDQRYETAQAAVHALQKIMTRLCEKGKLTSEEAQAALERLSIITSLSELADSELIIEAIIENLDIKQQLLRDLEVIVSKHCILASNTSSLSITAIASGCQHPERVAGFHFFNPVPLMKIVEVIDGLLTAPRISASLHQLAAHMGHYSVQASDTPGFIVNHASRGYTTESLRLLDENIADAATLDAILRDSAGFRMGPFELLDLTGLDVSLPVMESIYQLYYHEPRYRPSAKLRQRLQGGLLGRKTGQGFYRYTNHEKQTMPAARPGATTLPLAIWLEAPLLNSKLSHQLAASGYAIDSQPQPDPESICLIQPLGQDISTAALAQGLNPHRTLGIDPWSLNTPRLTLMSSPVTENDVLNTVWQMLETAGYTVSRIHDSPGFVCQRVLSMIVNIGCDMAQQAIATPEDIDRSVTLALGYPKGPLSLGDSLGPQLVLQVLESLFNFYRDPRYRPSPWLIRRALLGVSLLHPEG